jgi:hypothetical protein
MTETEYADFCLKYRDLIDNFAGHFESLKREWKDVTGRECPFADHTTRLSDSLIEVSADLYWSAHEIKNAEIIERAINDYLN